MPKKTTQLLAVFSDLPHPEQALGCAFRSEEAIKEKAHYKKPVFNYVIRQVYLFFPTLSLT